MKSKITKVSIITVVFNGESLIEGTIKSIINQTYPHFEYIIIDGQSTDKTMDIIQTFKDKIDIVVSEKDNGLYDAMNKALDIASGEYVWFVNCGDHIYKRDTLADIISKNKDNADILYGEVMLVNDERNALGTRSTRTTQKLPENLSWKSLKYGMVVCHQGFIPKLSICPKYIDDNLSADIDWVIKCLKNSSSNLNTHLTIAEYLVGGLSKKRHRESLFGRYRILQDHYGVLNNFFNHIYIALRKVFRL